MSGGHMYGGGKFQFLGEVTAFEIAPQTEVERPNVEAAMGSLPTVRPPRPFVVGIMVTPEESISGVAIDGHLHVTVRPTTDDQRATHAQMLADVAALLKEARR